MPGANERALVKAAQLPADALLLDLEDAVAPEAKQVAREAVCAAVSGRPYGKREVVVRINGLTTEWGSADLEAAVAAGPDAILAPKVDSVAAVEALSAAMDSAGAPASMALWAMIETPTAILSIREIAACGASTRLGVLVMGTNDLAKEMLVSPTDDRQCFLAALSMTVLAARANGLSVIDGVYNEIGNADGLRAESLQGRQLGFDGKTLIHPSQLETANAVFAPEPSDIQQARAVIEAFELAENHGKGVIKVNGKMTELLHLEQARRLVALDEAISSLAGN
jgi:citrate lyase subunit beta/citryl-CoA lyase